MGRLEAYKKELTEQKLEFIKEKEEKEAWIEKEEKELSELIAKKWKINQQLSVTQVILG